MLIKRVLPYEDVDGVHIDYVPRPLGDSSCIDRFLSSRGLWQMFFIAIFGFECFGALIAFEWFCNRDVFLWVLVFGDFYTNLFDNWLSGGFLVLLFLSLLMNADRFRMLLMAGHGVIWCG